MNRLRRVRPIALLVGWFTDIGGSSLFALVYMVPLMMSGRVTATEVEDPAVFSAITYGSPDIWLPLFSIGLLFSALAGYVAARIAGRQELLHGLLSSAACVLTGIVSFGSMGGASMPHEVAGLVLAPAAGTAGGYIWLKTRRRPTSLITPAA